MVATSQPTSGELATQVNDLLPTMTVKLLHFLRKVPETEITLIQRFLLRHLQVHGPCMASTLTFKNFRNPRDQKNSYL